MTVLELFAGAGGAYLGLRAAGLRCLAAVEWDASAAAALRAAGAPALCADVRDLGAIEAALGGERPDGIWASFPCQCWSAAGKRLGARDERNGWPWVTDAVDRFRPRWVACENVAGLAHHVGGCVGRAGQEGLFGAVDPMSCSGCYLERVILPDLRRRYAHAGLLVLDAADFGVPQHRRRLILWAGPSPLAAPVGTHGPGRARPWVSMGEALGLRDGGVGWVDRAGRGRAATEPWRLDAPAPTVVAAEVRGTRACAATGFNFHGGPDRAADAAFLAIGRRRLTVEECASLQGFPGGHPFTGPVGARYAQVGNAVPPALAEAIGAAAVAAWEDG